MHIRTATRDDIPAVMALEAQAATASHWRGEDYLKIFDDTAPRLALVVEARDGFRTVEGGGTTHPKLRAFLVALCAGPEWEIENIVVAIQAQRHGLATCLLAELLGRARAAGAEALFLEVRESNLAARALYEKHGFAETGRRKRYYSDPPEDAITYELRFPLPVPH